MKKRSDDKAEQELIEWARSIITKSAWSLGEAASEWCQKYARGRTDADFAALLDCKPDYISERRRVYETFADVRSEYGSLSWSHFKVCVPWDDAPECLAWAEQNKASVAEMRAWRRLQHGEDLTAESGDDGSPWGEEVPVRTGNTIEKTQAAIAPSRVGATHQDNPTLQPGSRPSHERDDDEHITIDRTPPQLAGMDPDSTVRRCTIALERINRLVSRDDFDLMQFVSAAVQERWQRVVDEFYEAHAYSGSGVK